MSAQLVRTEGRRGFRYRMIIHVSYYNHFYSSLIWNGVWQSLVCHTVTSSIPCRFNWIIDHLSLRFDTHTSRFTFFRLTLCSIRSAVSFFFSFALVLPFYCALPLCREPLTRSSHTGKQEKMKTTETAFIAATITLLISFTHITIHACKHGTCMRCQKRCVQVTPGFVHQRLFGSV